MSILSFILGSVFLLCIFELSNATKECYNAKTCIHNNGEKCGVDEKGNYRRFFDTCDMLEYNCLKKTSYTKTDPKNCKSLPPIEDEKSETKADDIESF